MISTSEWPSAGALRLAARRLENSLPSAVYAPLVVGAIVRFVGLDRLSFWLDEAYSAWYAQQPIEAILPPNAEVHPPGYYLFLHFWLMLGRSDWWTRAPSALAGCATILAVYGLGTALFSRRTGIAAAWLIAISPWHVWYSQEARMYAAVGLMATLSALAGTRWLKEADLPSGLIFIAAVLAGLYLDFTMLLVWPVEAALLPFLQPKLIDRRRAVGWSVLQLIIAAGFLPLAWLMQAQIGTVFSQSFLSNHLGLDGIPPLLRTAMFVVGGLGLGGIVGLLWLGWRRPASRRPIISIILIGGFILTVVVAPVPAGMTVKRTLLCAVPFACVGCAWAASALCRPRATLSGLLAISVASLVIMQFVLPKEPWREVVADIQRASRPGDLVLIRPGYYMYAFDHYAGDQKWIAGFYGPDPMSGTPARLASPTRVWLILLKQQGAQSPEGLDPGFTSRYAPYSEHEYFHISVRLFIRHQNST